MDWPWTVKQVHSFIGAVSFYHDMWPWQLHLLALLTEFTGKGKFIWTTWHQNAFDMMKALIAEDAMLCYLDHNLPFHIYTNASDYQLGALIMQNNKPVAYYSC